MKSADYEKNMVDIVSYFITKNTDEGPVKTSFATLGPNLELNLF